MHTKSLLIGLLLLLVIPMKVKAQGAFASEFKSLIGTKYFTKKDITKLNGFQYTQGIVLGDAINSGPYISMIDVYTKGTSSVVLLSKVIDATTKQLAIIDILKLSKIPKNHELRISDCQTKNQNPDEVIVAVIKSENKKQVTTIKQAFILKDIRFQKVETKGILCRNEGID